MQYRARPLRLPTVHRGRGLLPAAEQLLKYDAFESILWSLRKRLRRDIVTPPDWDDACRAVRQYFANPPSGVGSSWEPWKNYDFDLPAA